MMLEIEGQLQRKKTVTSAGFTYRYELNKVHLRASHNCLEMPIIYFKVPILLLILLWGGISQGVPYTATITDLL
jgi:hypothetical protein